MEISYSKMKNNQFNRIQEYAYLNVLKKQEIKAF